MKDVAVIVQAAAVAFIAWIVYKLVKSFKTPEPVVATVTTDDGKNVRLSGLISKPAAGGTAELSGVGSLIIGGRSYSAEAVVTNNGEVPVTCDILFETRELSSGLAPDSLQSASVRVSFAPGESKTIKAQVPIGSVLLFAGNVSAVMSLYVVAGGAKKSISMPVQFSI